MSYSEVKPVGESALPLPTTTKASSAESSHQQLGPRVVFTEGELLPLKGWWFRVEFTKDGILTLQKLKPTGHSVKVSKRESRWLRQHPRSTRARVAVAKSMLQSVQGLLSAQA